MKKSRQEKQLERQEKQWKTHDKKPETKKQKEKRLAQNKQQFMNRLITKPKKSRWVYFKKLCKDGKIRTIRKKVPIKGKHSVAKVKRIDW